MPGPTSSRPHALRRFGSDEDTQPLMTPADLGIDIPGRRTAPDEADIEERRSDPSDLEPVMSSEIPPPDHVELEDGRSVDGKDPAAG